MNQKTVTMADINSFKRSKKAIALHRTIRYSKTLYRRDEKGYAVYHDDIHVLETPYAQKAMDFYNSIGKVHLAYRFLEQNTTQLFSIVITDEDGAHDSILFRLLDSETWEQKVCPSGWSNVTDADLLFELDKIKGDQK